MAATGTWLFPSAFSNPLSADVVEPNDNLQATTTESSVYDGHIASFVFLVSGLEKSLRDNSPILFDSGTSFKHPRTPLGFGHSFIVEKAEWESRSSIGLEISNGSKWGKFVALKYVRRTEDQAESTNWKQILLEIRALLHEPIRYHPNIVRLLGLSWGAAQGTRSNLPMLVLELSAFGSLSHLQMNADPFPFKVKKKLCHDVSKGLSILHACGIAHGDLKQENVLIFRNKDTNADVIYTAKLSDFGGSVMDLDGGEKSLHMGTPPYGAPEARDRLDGEGLKQTDVYSLGLLVWRTILDGKPPFECPEFLNFTDKKIEDLKRSNQLLVVTKINVHAHVSTLEKDDMEILDYVFEKTIQAVAQDRSLRLTIAALQVTKLSEIEDLVIAVDMENEQERIMKLNQNPGQRGITVDGLGVFIAKSDYGDYDFQNKGPGHRPKLSSPDPAEFLFEPQRLKSLLDWALQVAIVRDLEQAANASPGFSATQISSVVASFYLFRCYMHEFGVQFNSERTCYWLKQAALSDDHCQENYLAQAWCWRVHQALGVTLDVGIATLRNWMMLSITRGHRNCITESFKISTLITGSDERKRWQDEIISCIKMLNTVTGGVGMPYFVPRKLRRQYNIEDLDVLDRDIQQEFLIRQVEKLDEIFVNHRGDGLLHMAASLGNLAALKHLVEKYNPDVNCANQANHETPLHCACRGGHLDCALFLLDRGASPDGSQWAEEMPLYWLCAFAENDIPIIAAKLVAAGATLNKGKGRSWAPPIWADSDNLFSLPVSPLSRAVMMQSIPAVTALLAVGADPIHDLSSRSSACPVVLAAVLTLPRILEMLLLHLSTRNPEIFPQKLITDMEILQIAVEQTATTVDVTSLENRITRHGADYKTAMFETLEILHLRGTKTTVWTNEGSENKARAANTMLARLVSLGRLDIVDSLLQLGHPVHGKPDACPILEATKLNHEPLFRLLVGHGASITMKISSATGVQRSLLQVFAERPSQSRPGLFIPEYLLKMGVAVDPLPDGSQPAFASAVKNQDFALADLLLQHGADINLSYAPQEGAPWVTVLGDLFRNPTDKSVESVKYLLRIDGRVKPGILVLPAIIGAIEDSSSLAPSLPLPDFIVEKQRNLSILHYAAMCVPKTNLESLVMGRMVRYILSVQKYSNADVINLRHPDGTALWLAALFCNLEVVAALLEKKADTGIRVRGFTALAIAQTMVANVVAGLKPEMDRVTKGQILKKYTLIVELLRNAAEQTQETNGFDLVRM